MKQLHRSLTTTPREQRANTWNYDTQKVRGVNLGGWFVLEPWITPSLFEQWANGGGVVDEYTYTAALGKQNAQSRLNQHWSSFITEADFREIASHGLNHVRIPVGYWAFNPNPADPYVQGQLPYLDNAIRWARNSGLRVMLDLHGGMIPISTAFCYMLIGMQLPDPRTASTTVEKLVVSTGNPETTSPTPSPQSKKWQNATEMIKTS